MGILKSHGGFVLVSSHLGKGTAFEVFLPATEDFIATPLPTLPSRRGKGELILIVDDEDSVGKITQASLETYHYRTLFTQDGQEAIDLYRNHQGEIQVVLMDMMMPNMTGIEVIQALQKINPQVKIIATSGLFTNKTLAAEAGVKAFLLKPYAISQLLQLLGALLPLEEPLEHPENPGLSSSAPPVLSRTALAELSPDWLQKMYDAAYRIDTDEMLELIAQMPDSHRAIAQALKALVLDFNTEIILDLTCP
jgi:CheY-like chemotaxis protein